MFSLPQLHTKSLCVLALQNSQFEASTSSRPQTVNFEALGHKAIMEHPVYLQQIQQCRINTPIYQIEIFAGFAEEEALHAVLLRLVDDAVERGIAAAGARVLVQTLH